MTTESNEVFLSYRHEDRGLANKAKQHLEKLGFTSFLAHEDIEVSKVWRDEILRQLKGCSGMITIVTPNFSESPWTNQEVGFVLGRNKPIVSLAFGVDIESLPAFLESLQAVPNVTEDNLEAAIAKTKDILEIDMKSIVAYSFEERAKQLTVPMIGDGRPMIQMVLGPVESSEHYLSVCERNVPLFSMGLPSSLPIMKMIPRRDYYEFEMMDQLSYFSIYSDGFFHAYVPFTLDDNPKRGTIHDIVGIVSGFLIFALRVLKVLNIEKQQRIFVELSGLAGLQLRADRSPLYGFEEYIFSKRILKETYSVDIRPNASWYHVFQKLGEFYGMICKDLGLVGIPNRTIEGNMKKILGSMSDISTGHRYGNREVLPRIDFKDMFEETN